ncbi:CIA30 family protein [Aspergillus clavatus NRRL 1]|uniref:NADH:ubiquinone oxidoreductase intermediate-associated protein 30 domain-containing protein n=1 Tax=Aspergillus clavatus (strain ATCC 1007 / CBS 513.65 / DSM 816 / NCTC 3887 / NRRL 1 / QM 1276 / 107) TaxID=344612 RepID=A1C5K3_ASPCL|nr:uncharacterized protein ACLA_003840 [Aspergillus clavatus NRRL 1]EAW14971.1 conserved hypothetical protein [Aspergillus clavatus NRRL 1]
MSQLVSHTYLFGGDQPWSPTDWTSSDDRVRGGASHSSLTITPTNTAFFHGHLDITALGGAGFASQRTTDNRTWDLSGYDGLALRINGSDGQRYTLTLKDEVLPKRADGREQSTLSWEYDFRPSAGIAGGEERVLVKWADLKATYRGREKEDAEPLDLSRVKRISIMIRSFFGTQEGDFELGIDSIAAFRTERYTDATAEDREEWDSDGLNEKWTGPSRRSGWRWLLGCCGL